MNSLMASRAPAGAAIQERRVIEITDEDRAGRRLLLVMAAQAKRLVARNQQASVDAAMRIVAGGAAFAHRFMLEHEGPGLRRVAFDADGVP